MIPAGPDSDSEESEPGPAVTVTVSLSESDRRRDGPGLRLTGQSGPGPVDSAAGPERHWPVPTVTGFQVTAATVPVTR